jgi:prepilin-type N-terminal cleavage/methylation domain-containing protein
VTVATPSGRHEAAFTLLEMIVVVALLAATAGASMVMLGGREQQQRHDETVRRLEAAVQAVAGLRGAAWGGEVRLSGFVSDNGRLPVHLLELSGRDMVVDLAECNGLSASTAPGLLNCHRPRAAVFDPSPDPSSGFDNASGDETVLTEPAALLPKGLQRYLVPRSGGHAWRDGWANVAVGGDDGFNFGWQIMLPATEADTWTLVSLGSDNAVTATAPSPDPELTADLSRSVLPDDWSVDLQGWTVRLTNATAAALPSSGYLGVSLLVWQSQAGGGHWRRLTSTLDATPLAAGASRDVSFPPGGFPGGGLSTRVPVGEHLLLAVHSADATAHDSDDTPLIVDGHRVVAQVRVYAGSARPVAELVLR